MKRKGLVSAVGMLVLLISIMVVTGCTTTRVEELGRFTIISSKNVDVSRLGDMKRSATKVETKRLNAKGLLLKM